MFMVQEIIFTSFLPPKTGVSGTNMGKEAGKGVLNFYLLP